MKNIFKSSVVICATAFLILACQHASEDASKSSSANDSAVVAKDPLPSWNDGNLKQDIIAYVTKVSKEGSTDFIPVKNRIATFDNDRDPLGGKTLCAGIICFLPGKKNGRSQSGSC